MWRGIGGFLLFFVSFSMLGSIVGVSSAYLLTSRFFSIVEDSWSEQLFRIVAGMASGYFGVLIGAYVLGVVMQGGFPARSIGLAFAVLLVANFVLHFIFFPEKTDIEVWYG